MNVTEPINIVIAVVGGLFPLMYIYFVNRFVNHDLEHTDEIAEQAGQTHHTAIINTEIPDGHAAHAADDELLPLHHHHHHGAIAH